jgi:hypothetical protein
VQLNSGVVELLKAGVVELLKASLLFIGGRPNTISIVRTMEIRAKVALSMQPCIEVVLHGKL